MNYWFRPHVLYETAESFLRSEPVDMHIQLLVAFGLLFLVTSLPIPNLSSIDTLIANATDLSGIQPIGEAFLEGDSDSGGEDKGAGDANSVANGYTTGGSVGSGSSSFNRIGSTSGSSVCCESRLL